MANRLVPLTIVALFGAAIVAYIVANQGAEDNSASSTTGNAVAANKTAASPAASATSAPVSAPAPRVTISAVTSPASVATGGK